mmetsp:Transcript_355/g.737  ORF Transcript_355/g.737 Transcript_355/m.737 type:complete len:207 (-) Transcript_355:43-663(-)
MAIFIHVAQAGSFQSRKGDWRWKSRVLVNGCGNIFSEMFPPIATSIKEGNMPLWNEILVLPTTSTSSTFNVTLMVCRDFELDGGCVEQCYSVDLTMPDDEQDSYCDEWIELPRCLSAKFSCSSVDYLRDSINLRLACSRDVDYLAELKKGLCPLETSNHRCFTVKPRPLHAQTATKINVRGFRTSASCRLSLCSLPLPAKRKIGSR